MRLAEIDLTWFRNIICKALLFINILYLVLTISLKIQAENLYRVPVDIPMWYLSWGRFNNFTLWQMSSLKCDKLECGEEDFIDAKQNNPDQVG